MTVLAIDVGTTGVTALLVSTDASIVARGYREFPQHFPHEGWVEHDPAEIWAAVQDSCSQVLADDEEPTAIGITNQRETLVLWDRETLGSPRKAIVWQDRRTAGICSQLRADGHED
ncbi:MAG: glycerol kinase GlpK, partial [Actinomycetota bacterium]